MSAEMQARLFLEARSQNRWLPRPVPDSLLRELYELMKWGPTSMNSSPLRVLFLRSEEARQRLLPAMAAPNVDKVRTAPVLAIVAYDTCFYERMPYLFPHRPEAGDLFRRNVKLSQDTAFRNSSLQGAYLMVAARLLGLDCGPLSGFDEQRVNDTFFADSSLRVNFLCGLGYGDPDGLFPRHPRLPFEEACQLL
ncbi:malonic semialdehyde reductase [Duganella radicis]|uniref:Putative NADH dehydrogenase/NAD(P)H nitroreductase GM676_05440 n=1 Tax=Duganella radicis TaxID=551988 RepID=A0A6L6PDC7_9BURK|nr:malonic semialdehyde reductase [Duganella radicis]MTV37024.1 malonic semialdehyde reductase [Duganella radicis]